MVGENTAYSLCVHTWLSFGCKNESISRRVISDGVGHHGMQPGFTIVFIAYLLKRDAECIY